MEKSFDTQDKTLAMEDDDAEDIQIKEEINDLDVIKIEKKRKILACPVENCEYHMKGIRADNMPRHLKSHKREEGVEQPTQKWYTTFTNLSRLIEKELIKEEPITKSTIFSLLQLIKSTMFDLYTNINDREKKRDQEKQKITRQTLELPDEDCLGLTLEQRIRRLEINNKFQDRLRDLYREPEGGDYDIWIQDFKHRTGPKTELCKLDARVNLTNKKIEEIWSLYESEFKFVYWELDRIKEQYHVRQNELAQFVCRCNAQKKGFNKKFLKLTEGVKDFRWTDKTGNRPTTEEEKEQDKKEFEELYSLFKLYRDKDEIPAGVSKGAIGEYVTLRHFVEKPYHPRAKSLPFISRFDKERTMAPDPAPLPKLLP